ncbi:hypothetical protein [Paraliomyxa miuraensis]|uniref:hypothetical protein n=1 Tax=Paraliomyxa miuraensis TaxID=376150 RepID=UPI00225469F7|nr:hypothetical protein [Paraliomyxa miuraensis]MCX4246876.1 hypothetical protein [Paraliomyxa miuraensis]
MRFASLCLRTLAIPLVVAPLSACGDDEGETGATTTTTTNSTASSSSTDADSGTTAVATTDEPGTSTDMASTTAESADSTTGGPAGDPAYPPIDNGSCPSGTAPVLLPGAHVCAPFCGSADDMCPMAASGDAPAQCTPFAGMGGSGDPCDDMTPCAMNETCNEGTCADVAFWACQLVCADGQACPDGMQCSGVGTCGYP